MRISLYFLFSFTFSSKYPTIIIHAKKNKDYNYLRISKLDSILTNDLINGNWVTIKHIGLGVTRVIETVLKKGQLAFYS